MGSVYKFYLEELEPRFISLPHADNGRFHEVHNIKEAYGVQFLCPECYFKNKGEEGTHRIMIWDEKCPKKNIGLKNKWLLEGNKLSNLTLNSKGSRSIFINAGLEGGCAAHFHVTNGIVTSA